MIALTYGGRVHLFGPVVSRSRAGFRITHKEDAMHRQMLLVCTILFVSASPAAAQYTQYALPTPQYPVLELSVGFTAMSRGPGDGSERAMRAIGFQGSSQMTNTLLDGFWKIEVGVRPQRTLGILTTRVRNGTYGSRPEPADFLRSHHVIVTRAVTWSYRPNGWLSIGAGPALHKRRFSIESDRGPISVQSDWGLGAVAGANVKFKRQNGTFLHAMCGAPAPATASCSREDQNSTPNPIPIMRCENGIRVDGHCT